MRRWLLYPAALVVLAIPTALLADAIHETDEERLELVVAGLEEDRLGSLLDHAALDSGGLVVSARDEAMRFDATTRDQALDLLDDLTGIESASRVRLSQHEVRLDGDRATAVLSLRVEGDRPGQVALRLVLSRSSGEWLVERIRVMS